MTGGRRCKAGGQRQAQGRRGSQMGEGIPVVAAALACAKLIRSHRMQGTGCHLGTCMQGILGWDGLMSAPSGPAILTARMFASVVSSTAICQLEPLT